MTNRVVPSDVTLARRLLAAGFPNDGVVGALCKRGVRAEAARNLLERLTCGKPAEVEVPAIPESARSRRFHRRRRGVRGGIPRPTVPTMCPASNEPLYFHYDHRPSWRRRLKRALRWTFAGVMGLVVLASGAYVAFDIWERAQQNKARFETANPDWDEQLNRMHTGLAEPACDNLKAAPPSNGKR